MDNILIKETWINSPIQEVFKCFTEEKAMLTWHGKEVELDAVPGGKYKVTFANGDVILGNFVEVIPNKRVVYQANYGPVRTKVEIDLVSERGGTTVQIMQTFLPGQDISTFTMGWDYFTGILKAGLEGNTADENCRY